MILPYPDHYTDQQKETFDKIRNIARQIVVAHSLIVEDQQSNHVLIEVSCDTISPQMWDLLEDVNTGSSGLTCSYAYTKEDIKGDRYVIGL